ncbi:hypothetical protein CpipJ_CPIJ011254 [Culex quinquefasciatus]|uniref:Uncharacterized protein n=1 Tax=Culex quinquefasciatus TaxID=7176 RepID=B0WX14_CULQU|nr:hypothetical protein CpipJ_CPIJ011254 [Culex quinquefasciatus]|eukprot:XP_001861936.1 hypothetical protein CpipJ_CPIJ011254 [Culex quinquefasciatus]
MKYVLVTLALLVLAVALVSALPAVQDESLFGGPLGEAQEVDIVNPQDPQSFIKWRKLKRLLLLG